MKAPCSAREGTILVEVLLLYFLTFDHRCGLLSLPFTFLDTQVSLEPTHVIYNLAEPNITLLNRSHFHSLVVSTGPSRSTP